MIFRIKDKFRIWHKYGAVNRCRPAPQKALIRLRWGEKSLTQLFVVYFGRLVDLQEVGVIMRHLPGKGTGATLNPKP